MIQRDEVLGVVLGFFFVLLLQAYPERQRLAAFRKVVALCGVSPVLCLV